MNTKKGDRIKATLTLEIELPCPLDEYVLLSSNTAVDATFHALDRIQITNPELKDFSLNWNQTQP